MFKEWRMGKKFEKAFAVAQDKDAVNYFQGENEI